MKPNVDYSLYLVTDQALMSTKTLEEAVEQAIIGGCTLIQLREKSACSLDFYNTALAVKKITDNYNVALIINDRIDIALAIDCAGVHIGQSDIPAEIARRVIGADKILGVSASTIDEAVNAQNDGADYIGVGAMFETGTKTDAQIVSMDELKKIKAAVSIPLVVIGGINKNTIPLFKGMGINGVAVVSAVISQENIKTASESIIGLLSQGVVC